MLLNESNSVVPQIAETETEGEARGLHQRLRRVEGASGRRLIWVSKKARRSGLFWAKTAIFGGKTVKIRAF